MRDIAFEERTDPKFHGLLESARDAIVIANDRGEIMIVNSQTEKLFGYSRAELLGQAIELLAPERFRGRAPARRTAYFVDPKLRPIGAGVELFGRHKDGSEFPVEVSLSPLKTAEGTLLSSAIRDITERKRFEEALRNANRLQEQLRRLSQRILSAQEEERKKISRELHDVIAQTLTGINIRLATLKQEAMSNATGLGRSIARTQRLVEKSVNMVHQFARELRPAVLDDLGLIPALHSFMKNFTERTGVRTRLTAFAEVERLDTDERTVLFRVAQEALTNVARHAQASRVEVRILKMPGRVCMRIKDDGKSFQVDRVLRGQGGKHLGLLGMKERLEMIGGRFDVESTPGLGTTIQAQIRVGKDARGQRKDFAGSKLESL